MKLSARGREWIIEALGCRPELLRDPTALQTFCDALVRELDLHVIGQPVWHAFGGHAGVTGLYLLSESHLACHTYPEFAALTLNLYSCRERPAWPWQERISAAFGAATVNVRSLERALQ